MLKESYLNISKDPIDNFDPKTIKNDIYETNDNQKIEHMQIKLQREQSFNPNNIITESKKQCQSTETEDVDCMIDNESSRDSNRLKNQINEQQLLNLRNENE